MERVFGLQKGITKVIFHVIDQSDYVSYQEVDVDRVGLSLVTLHINKNC